MKIGMQLYLGLDTPLLEEVRPVKNSDQAASYKKPARDTGLWTSTWNPETQTSAWSEWSASNWKDPYEMIWHLLTPRDGVNLYIIDSLDDLHTLLDRFPWETERQQRRNSQSEQVYRGLPEDSIRTTKRNQYYADIDFERLATEYDGIWLTEQGITETYYSDPHDIHAWSTESVLWFRWCFSQVERIATPARPQDDEERAEC